MVFVARDVRRNRKDRSWVWPHFRKVQCDPEKVGELRKLDPKAHTTICSCPNVQSCNICFYDEETTLGTSLRAASKGQSTNLIKHMRQYHPELVPVIQQKRGNSFTDSTAASAKKARLTSPTLESIEDSSVANSDVKPPVPHSIQAMINRGADCTVDEFHEIWVDFGTNNNLSQRALTDKTACPELFKLLQFAMDHGSALRNHPRRFLGKARYTRIRKDKYESLLAGFTSWQGQGTSGGSIARSEFRLWLLAMTFGTLNPMRFLAMWLYFQTPLTWTSRFGLQD